MPADALIPSAREGALSLGQAAQALGISTTTVRRWADDGRLPSTRTAGGHRRFATSEVRRMLAERGRPAVAPARPPRCALPALADLVDADGAVLAELSWRGLYGELRTGFFVEPRAVAPVERWLAALASAAATADDGWLVPAQARGAAADDGHHARAPARDRRSAAGGALRDARLGRGRAAPGARGPRGALLGRRRRAARQRAPVRCRRRRDPPADAVGGADGRGR